MDGPFLSAVERELGPAFGLASAERKGHRLEARLSAVRVEKTESMPELRATVQIVGYRGGAIFDVKEAELPLGSIEPELERTEWSSAMADAARALGEAVSAVLERSAGDDAFPDPWALSPSVAVPRLLATWAQHGPPPPRPNRFPESDVAPVAARIRALKKDEVATLASKLPSDAEPIAFGFSIDGWALVVCLDREEDLGRAVVFSPAGERGTLFVYEIDGAQGASAHPIDGDTVTLRGVLEWLGRVLRAAKLDKRFKVGEDHGAHGLTPSQWMRFRDRERPLVDWRVQGDSVGEGPLSDGHVPALRTEEGRANADLYFYRNHPLSEVIVYDTFVRTFVDPSFVSQPALPHSENRAP